VRVDITIKGASRRPLVLTTLRFRFERQSRRQVGTRLSLVQVDKLWRALLALGGVWSGHIVHANVELSGRNLRVDAAVFI
jgi:hypothetical protein